MGAAWLQVSLEAEVESAPKRTATDDLRKQGMGRRPMVGWQLWHRLSGSCLTV